MSQTYRVGKLEQAEFQKYGVRLMSALKKEFPNVSEWSFVPSLLVLFGTVILTRGGVQKEDIDRMVAEYIKIVDQMVKTNAN